MCAMLKAIGTNHHYVECWGPVPHPHGQIHNLIAETAFYFVAVEVAAASTMLSTCKALNMTFKQAMPSAGAMAHRQALDPNTACPNGPLVYHSSNELFATHAPLSAVGPNSNSSQWALIEDRPDKFGWVLEAPSGDAVADTICFNVTLGAEPHVTLEYMHSYVGVGKVKLTLKQGQNGVGNGLRVKLKPAEPAAVNGATHSGQPIGPGTDSVILDSYQPAFHNALYTEFELHPVGTIPGPALLCAQLLVLSGEETAERGGGKFKITGVHSC